MTPGTPAGRPARIRLALLCASAALLAACGGGGSPRSGIASSAALRELLLGNQPPGTSVLFVNVSGPSLGMVATSPALSGWVCDAGGDACGGYAPLGAAVTIDPKPGAGAVLQAWGGQCSGNGPCELLAAGLQTVTAVFVPQAITVLLSGLGQGTVTSSYAPPACGGGQCVLALTSSAPSTVTLTAAASSGSYFAGWFGAGCSGTGSCTVATNEAQTLNAFFATTETAVSVWVPVAPLVSAPGGGTVSATNTQPSSCAFTGSSTNCVLGVNTAALPQGVTLTAAPNASSTFTGWGGACSGTGACQLSVTQPVSVTAVFQARELSVSVTGQGTVTANPNVGLSCSGGTCTVPFTSSSPASLTLSATPAAGFSFFGWSGACSGTGTCQVSTAQACTVLAFFQGSGSSGSPPVIESFAASPATVAPGQGATLSWIVAGATSVTLDQGLGAQTGSSVGVTPSATTTYTLTAANANGSSSMTTTLAVGTAALSLAGFEHPAGWVDTSLTVQCPNEVQYGGSHACGADMTFYGYYVPQSTSRPTCLQCHGNGSDFTSSGGPSLVSCGLCHTNAFASTTCSGLGASSPCSCDLCHGSTVINTNFNSSQCSLCHSNVTAITAGDVSSHSFGGSSSATCTTCHDMSTHMSGTVRIVGVGATSCTSCHAGEGQTLGSSTPPLLAELTGSLQTSGYQVPLVNGDFHEGTAGSCFDPNNGPEPCPSGVTPTGFGGTLAAPYARGQGSLPCETCHDDHASGNAFLLAATVNGVSIPANSLGSPGGVGAEQLCGACHLGQYHSGCLTSDCHNPWHGASPYSHTSDPAPPGSPCFYCHGHEGLTGNWLAPWPFTSTTSGNWCNHCHSQELPGPSANGPGITSSGLSCSTINCGYTQPYPQLAMAPSGTVYDIGSTSASVYWETNEAANSLVEYGVGTAGYVAGSTEIAVAWAMPPYTHNVTITGLTPNTAYVWRVRTVDGLRNVTEPALQSFTTASASVPGVPAPTAEPTQENANPGCWESLAWAVSPALAWQPVTLPNGDAVQYDLQYGPYPFPASNITDTGWISSTSYPASVTGSIGVGVAYYWRVMARDARTGMESSWSPVSSFIVILDNPNNENCY